MGKDLLFPDYIFESSWEVCNKVGGIYTVLSTRAKTLQERLHDHILFIGPDCWGEKPCPYFSEDDSLFSDWKAAVKDELKMKIGRWNVPGSPIAILVDFQKYFSEKDEISESRIYSPISLQILILLITFEQYSSDTVSFNICSYISSY